MTKYGESDSYRGKGDYRAVIEEEQARRDEALCAALQAVRERTESIIPDPAIWDSGDEI